MLSQQSFEGESVLRVSMGGDEIGALVEVLLGDMPSGLNFAEAVVRHLARDGTGRPVAEIIRDVVVIIATIADDGDTGIDAAAASLASRPEILASFFQNADLLPPDAPLTDLIARSVAAALATAAGRID